MNLTLSPTSTFNFGNVRTYLAAAIFIMGNVALPQLCHLIPDGGFIFLPIYLFTLIGALVFGWQVGLLTALASPLVNYLLFGMPPLAMLPVIEVKSVILAAVAGLAVMKFNKMNFLAVAGVVILSQVIGCAFEWMWTQSFSAAVQDFRIGLPGIALQILAGYLCVRFFAKGRR